MVAEDETARNIVRGSAAGVCLEKAHAPACEGAPWVTTSHVHHLLRFYSLLWRAQVTHNQFFALVHVRKDRVVDQVLLYAIFRQSRTSKQRQPMTLEVTSTMQVSNNHHPIFSTFPLLPITLFFGHVFVKVFPLRRFMNNAGPNGPVTKVFSLLPFLRPSRKKSFHYFQNLLLHD